MQKIFNVPGAVKTRKGDSLQSAMYPQAPDNNRILKTFLIIDNRLGVDTVKPLGSVRIRELVWA